MNEYNAMVEPDPQSWLLLDEDIRMDLVNQFVEENEDIDDEAIPIHSAVHVIVENQLAEKIRVTVDAYARLLRQGLDRHEVIHAIGVVISGDIFDMLDENKGASGMKYKSRLRKLTAKRWRKGQY